MAGGIEFWPEREPRAGRVEHADGFVGQLAAGQIAVREPHGRCDAFVQNAHFVVLLQRRDHAAQHHQALLFGRLFHFDYLETAGQRGILFEVLLVFGPGGGGDGAQFAAGQRRLQQVGGIALPRLRRRRRSWCGLRR